MFEDVVEYPSLLSYWNSQIECPMRSDFNTSDESARIRVHNTILRVPYHLERFIWVGVIACLDTLLVLSLNHFPFPASFFLVSLDPDHHRALSFMQALQEEAIGRRNAV